MKLLIGPCTPKKFKDSLSVDKICGIDKSIEYQVYLCNCIVNEIGLVMDTEILLDELFITLKIKEVYLQKCNENVKEYCRYYGVPFYEI